MKAPLIMLLIFGWQLISACSECQTIQAGELQSPDGRYTVQVLTRVCDVRESSTIVSLSANTDNYRDDDQAILVLDSGVRVKAVWITSSLLDIELPYRATMISGKNQLGDVRIRYRRYSKAFSRSRFVSIQ